MPPSDDVLVAVITTFGIILTALLGYLGVVATGARRHAKATRNEIQNSHDMNFRDDLDEKFGGLSGLMRIVIKDQGGMKEDIRLIRREAIADREHIRELEQIRSPARKRATPNKENK